MGLRGRMRGVRRLDQPARRSCLPTAPPLPTHACPTQIRIGPKAPAFLTPSALKVIVDKYNLQARQHTLLA